jgi:4-hydroxymandelate oxidase
VARWSDSLEELASGALPEPVHRYFRQGARDGRSTAEAGAAWDRYRLLPQVLHDVTSVDTSTSLLGTSLRSPFAVAPTTLQRAAHPDGEVAMAAAVAASQSLMVVSSNAGRTFEEIAQTGVAWWLQAYVPADRPTCKPLLERAAAAGAQAVVLTADTPVVGTKYDQADTVWDVVDPSWLRVNFDPSYGTSPGDEKATDLGPHDIGWLAETSGLPVVVKGVLRADDARRCVDAGAAAVWVSNHGGRQLDYAVAPADCLASVVAAVGPDAEVYVDGGVRNARHAVIARALGATGVFLGRLPLYALAVDGEHGVVRLLAELEAELVETLRLLGCGDLTALEPGLLSRATTNYTDVVPGGPIGPPPTAEPPAKGL